MREKSLEDRIYAVVAEAASVITQIVRGEIAAQVHEAIAKQSAGVRGRATSSKRKTRSTSVRNLPRHCVFPECTRPHKGPRFSFLCDEHMGISKTEKKKHLDAWKASHAPASKDGNAKAKIRSRRGERLDEATLSRVLKVVADNPGLRSEEIYDKLPVPPAVTKKALAKLRADKRVKTKGERRAMTYAAA